MTQTLLTQRLLALFGAGLLLLNFPLLRLWLGDPSAAPAAASGTVLGLPLLPLALFVVWVLLIGVLALLMEHAGERDQGRDPG